MEQNRRLYPIGTQNFAKLRNNNFVYVDKTELVYRMTHSESTYVFLSRPRRFGKSLLVSTLQYYFEGRRELFEGLAIERLETEWEQYPVLRFDLSMGKHMDNAVLVDYLLSLLQDYEGKYGIVDSIRNPNIRLRNLIRAANEKTGKQVVVLIDEYDAPLLDTMHDDGRLTELRQTMRNFYSPLKGCDEYLRFVFLTGITKFSQLSIFSELNNIKNISMMGEYAAVCGISREELTSQLMDGVERIAQKSGLTTETAMEKLIENYDGYHFTWPSPDIFNPYSLLNAFSDGKIQNYWFGSGTPTVLIEMMRKHGVTPAHIGNVEASAESFDAPTERMRGYIPLFYQSGYLTIKGLTDDGRYLLDIPNKEVRVGLMDSLLTEYVSPDYLSANSVVYEMWGSLRRDDMDGALRTLQTFLKTVPYTDNASSEGHFQQVFYIIFSLLGIKADVEVRTPKGRVDMVLRTPTRLYVVELKLDRNAAAAMAQIDMKDYPSRFALCGLPVTKVAVNFDSEARNISDWKIENSKEIL